MKTYLTEYEKDGKTYGGERVEAYSWWHAELLLLQQGRLNETIIGEFMFEIDFDWKN